MVDIGNPAPAIDTVDDGLLRRLIRADQLSSIRRDVLTVLPINVAFGLTGTLVTTYTGHGLAGALWFILSTAINLGRMALCHRPYPRRADARAGSSDAEAADDAGVERHLRQAWLSALASGLAWAILPMLSDNFTSSHFSLMVICCITAGSVTHVIAYAAVPRAFVTPPLLSAAASLIYAGSFDNIALALTMLLYLAALIRITHIGETSFRASSRLKNEATALAQSLRIAHAHAEEVAREMSHRAVHDSLTGLLNREGFMREAKRLLAGHARTPQDTPAHESPCMLLLDLDDFKSINDIFGHATGDEALASFGQLLQHEVAGHPAVAGRLGGDEFAIVLLGPESSSTALAERIIAVLAREPVRQHVPMAVGIGICRDGQASLSELLACSDAALTVAKRAGRNQFHVFDDTLRQQIERWRDAKRDVAQAIAQGDIETWFQPIVCDHGQRIDSFEALMRWPHPTHRSIPPEEIITVAAGTGQSEALLRLLLASVCRFIGQLQAVGLEDVRVAMNVSPREMSHLPVDTIVLGVLRQHNVATRHLEIEITEETALDIETAQAKLAALEQAGVRIAIDDFGVGYSSLATLRNLSMHRLKIDRSFVRDLASSAVNRVLVRTILDLGRWLGVEVVAEGVETASDQATLNAMGCDRLQGYHFAQPMPAEAALEWAAARRVHPP
ncbi:MAG: EAL domain-containing protein [Comamonas sp.]